jgi:hypothetical protein
MQMDINGERERERERQMDIRGERLTKREIDKN